MKEWYLNAGVRGSNFQVKVRLLGEARSDVCRVRTEVSKDVYH